MSATTRTHSAPAPAPALPQTERTRGQGRRGRHPAHTLGNETTRRQGRLAFWFLLPTVGGISLFTLLPIVASIALSFFSWDIISAPKFIGFDNYTNIAADHTVRVAFLNTILFVLVAVVLQIALALTLAILVTGHMPGWMRTFFRSAFFFPLILSAASVSVIMKYLFDEDFGVINWLLGLFHIPEIHWFASAIGAQFVVILVYVWQSFGFTFLLFLGALSGIPKEVKEAASLDGATGRRMLRHVTLPLISPTMLVASVMAMIGALQVFDQPYVLTNGGPGDSTRTAVMVIYETAFRQLQFGKASAIGVVLMVIIMAVTALQFRMSRRLVFYQ